MRIRTQALCLGLAMMTLNGTTMAAVVQPDDMFFAPLSLVEAVHPSQPMDGDGVSTPWEVTWIAADILALDPGRVDITFLGIEVLPVLVENPSSASEEGEYTNADLAAITVLNYASFYMQQAGTSILDTSTDYAADLSVSQVTLTITAPALYAVRIQTESRSGVGQPLENVDYVYSQFAAADLGEKENRDDHQVQREVKMFDSDCYVISQPDSECVGGFDWGTACTMDDTCNKKRCQGGTNNGQVCPPASCPGGSCESWKTCKGGTRKNKTCTLPDPDCPDSTCEDSKGRCNYFNSNGVQNLTDADMADKVCRAATIAAAEQCIEDCKAANRKCHGGMNNGQVCTMSAECPGGDCPPERKVSVTIYGHGSPGSISMGSERIQSSGGTKTPEHFGRAIKECVSAVNFWGCRVGNGEAGQKFVDDVGIGASLPAGKVRAIVNTVSAERKSTISGKARAGYYDEWAKAKRTKSTGSGVPALSTGLLPAIGLALALAMSGLAVRWRGQRRPRDTRS